MSLRVVQAVAGYQRAAVLHGVDVDVEPGEVVSVLGANGAGKTTLARTMIGLLELRAGRIEVDGVDVGRAPVPQRVERGMALVPEGRSLFHGMRVRENLELGAYRRTGRGRPAISDVLDLFPALQPRLDQAAGTLSGGEQQMLAIGRAIMAQPRYLILDEPSLGLAPLVVERILEQVRALADDGVGVVLIEQNATVALDASDRAIVLDRGVVVVAGRAEALRTDAAIVGAYLGSLPGRDHAMSGAEPPGSAWTGRTT